MIGEVVDTLRKRSTPEQQGRIARLRTAGDDNPSPEREAVRAEIALAVHGIHVELWACICGMRYEYPHSRCQSCKRDYPRKCLTSGCGGVSDAAQPYCVACAASDERQGRAMSYARSGISPRERAAAQRLITYPHQADALAELDRWLDLGPESRSWRRSGERGGTCAAYIGGDPGGGKTTLAAHFAYQAFVESRLVTDFRWHSQATLSALFAERWVQGNDKARARAERASADWNAVTECPLLIIDDLFADPLTPAFGAALAKLIRERLDRALPLVMTGNHRLQWAVWFEHDVGRLESRWCRDGVELYVGGQDLRRVT